MLLTDPALSTAPATGSLASAAVSGFTVGLSLIVAIGAQNAFVLRQGLLRRHVWAVVAVCALSDAVLIVAGVAGLGAVIQQVPTLLEIIRWAGALFLFGYALLAFRRAWHGTGGLAGGTGPTKDLGAVVLTCLALTWLNPHVYLDTVLLLGSVAQHSPSPWWFAAGAVLASLTWFTGLGVGARFLRPVFARPGAWRVLDVLIGVVMVAIGVGLLLG